MGNNQFLIYQARENFINDRDFDSSELNDYIIQSWRRSMENNVDPHLQVIPTTANYRNMTIHNISNEVIYFRRALDKIFNLIGSMLDNLNALLLFLDKNLCVFNKFGNKDLEEQLRKKNIRFGTCFSEDIIGTNAAAIAQATGQNCWVIGYEHYIDALTEYASFGRASLNTAFYSPHYIEIVIPCAHLNDFSYTCINYIVELYNSLVTYSVLPSISPTGIFASQYMQQHKTAYLIVNPSGEVIDANQYFYETFNKIPDDTVGNVLGKVLPELKLFLHHLNDRESSYYEIVFPLLPENKKTFLVENVAIRREEFPIGTAIVLKNKDILNKDFNRLTNVGAYFNIDNLIGNSKKFRALKKLIEKSAQSSSNVLIIGESGTGKELIAQAIHNLGPRRNNPFISINCSAIPKELIGSELFGYNEGAFTGARKGGAPGKFELAHQGTLFLDEIGDMPLDMQSALLRVLEDNKITRIGGGVDIDVDVRILAATNCDLYKNVMEKKFRLDLYYRLNVIQLNTIPLRERLDDLPILIDYILKDLSKSFGKKISSLSPRIMQLFYEYSWPGNIRELRNVLERVINFTESSYPDIEDLPPDFLERINSPSSVNDPISQLNTCSAQNEYASYAEYEKQQIIDLMIQYRGNKSAVARALGITRKTLYLKLKKYSIQ